MDRVDHPPVSPFHGSCITNEVTSWRLHLPLALPADPTQPLTVTINALRFAPNHNIRDLPEKIDGHWSFTFVPTMS